MQARAHLRQVSKASTFVTGVDEWAEIAKALRAEGETRLADAIEAGVKAQRKRNYSSGNIPLRFRDGSVSKLERYR